MSYAYTYTGELPCTTTDPMASWEPGETKTFDTEQSLNEQFAPALTRLGRTALSSSVPTTGDPPPASAPRAPADQPAPVAEEAPHAG